MADKIQKLLKKLSKKEREIIGLLLLRIKLDDTKGLDIRKIQGHKDLYRVRKRDLRIIYQKNEQSFLVLKIDKRNEKTYKDF